MKLAANAGFSHMIIVEAKMTTTACDDQFNDPPIETSEAKARPYAAGTPENIRAGDPYDDPAFERLAREHDVWGRADSALCAVFWLAGKAQPPSGQSAATVGAPDRIFLVIGEDIPPDTPFGTLAEVTWCPDRVNDTDIEYVRAQRAAAMPDEIEGLRAHVALLKSALAQSERENDELRRAQPPAATAAPSLMEVRHLWDAATEATGGDGLEAMQHFAALVAAAEREECAKACEYRAMALDYSGNQYVRDHAALDCARSIRSRGKT